MFKDTSDGQPHSYNDGCGEPAHNSCCEKCYKNTGKKNGANFPIYNCIIPQCPCHTSKASSWLVCPECQFEINPAHPYHQRDCSHYEKSDFDRFVKGDGSVRCCDNGDMDEGTHPDHFSQLPKLVHHSWDTVEEEFRKLCYKPTWINGENTDGLLRKGMEEGEEDSLDTNAVWNFVRCHLEAAHGQGILDAHQAPMGVSQWREHGNKYGYDMYFIEQAREEGRKEGLKLALELVPLEAEEYKNEERNEGFNRCRAAIIKAITDRI